MDNRYEIESNVKAEAKEVIECKGYTLYMIDIECYHGLCCLAFKNGHYITEDLAIWHMPYKGDLPEEGVLRQRYINRMNNKLFTEDELSYVKSYDDWNMKMKYLHDYYHKERDYLSMFHIIHNEAEEKEYNKQKKKYSVTNPIGYCYNLPEDKDFIVHQVELYNNLVKARTEMENNPDYMVSAFYYEMCNHEYMINWQADWDVCSCFGDCKYGEMKGYVEYLTEMGHPEWILLYTEARKKYYKAAEENDWG